MNGTETEGEAEGGTRARGTESVLHVLAMLEKSFPERVAGLSEELSAQSSSPAWQTFLTSLYEADELQLYKLLEERAEGAARAPWTFHYAPPPALAADWRLACTLALWLILAPHKVCDASSVSFVCTSM